MRWMGIVAVVALIAAPASADFLTNGGFNDSLAGWTATADPFPAVPEAVYMTAGSVWGPSPAPLEGSGMAGRGYGGNVGGGNAVLYQTITVPAGQALSIDGYVAGGVGGFGNFNGTAWWEVRVIEGGYTNPDAGTLLWKREGTYESYNFNWDHVVTSYVPNSTQITLVLKHGAWDPQWDYTYFGAYYDQFSVTPEPSALLLGLLGLPLLRLRRHA